MNSFDIFNLPSRYLDDVGDAFHGESASTIFVDEGMTLKRIKPRAKGRADRILKRSCHITVKVSEK